MAIKGQQVKVKITGTICPDPMMHRKAKPGKEPYLLGIGDVSEGGVRFTEYGQGATFCTQHQLPFFPEELIIPEHLKSLFVVDDFKVGKYSCLLSSSPVGGESIKLSGDRMAVIGQQVSLQVTYIGGPPKVHVFEKLQKQSLEALARVRNDLLTRASGAGAHWAKLEQAMHAPPKKGHGRKKALLKMIADPRYAHYCALRDAAYAVGIEERAVKELRFEASEPPIRFLATVVGKEAVWA